MAVDVILQELHGAVCSSERISRDTAQRLRSY
jgi:hypothetical protein